ncbi:hypothetical protein [Ornithinimicrobium cavernae]|uniref:hypothetical protein n=1 Tax=Ornithinimicrobium cavernae TaxID=2666047 RepID=UPI000D68A870|nr:hypothetical protein [Ornithinimicrobium cavernae]
MHILLDSPVEAQRARNPVALWPLAAIGTAVLLAIAVSTAASSADLPDSSSTGGGGPVMHVL